MKNTILLTKHFDITKFECIFEILMNDGRYLYYEFDNRHKVTEKITWHL